MSKATDTEHIQITVMAVADAIATERKRCIAICEGWIETFQDREIKYTSARDYAVDAIEDIIGLIREGRRQTGWQPIETAPHEIEFIGQDSEGRVFNCRWEADDGGENWYDVHGDQLAYPVRWMLLP